MTGSDVFDMTQRSDPDAEDSGADGVALAGANTTETDITRDIPPTNAGEASAAATGDLGDAASTGDTAGRDRHGSRAPADTGKPSG